MTDEVSLDQVMARRFDLAEEIAIIQGRQKAELEPLAEEQTLCERFIKDAMNKGNMQQLKITGVGSAHFTTKDSVKVSDMGEVIGFILAAAPPMPGAAENCWPEVLQYIQAHAMWGLLNNAVNKSAAKEIIEANKAPPPGVEYTSFRDLNWTRDKKKAS
jgi:hypothetical protein